MVEKNGSKPNGMNSMATSGSKNQPENKLPENNWKCPAVWAS
jgi:hypothetical protein